MGRLKRSQEQIQYDIAHQEKECCVCNTRKPFSEFFNYRNKNDGKSYRCKQCDTLSRHKWKKDNPEKSHLSARGRRLKHIYGITLGEYNTLFEAQGCSCAICGVKENKAMAGYHKHLNFSVDHNHDTGKVRGLLCSNCNRGLGFLGDSPGTLEKALEYLKKNH